MFKMFDKLLVMVFNLKIYVICKYINCFVMLNIVFYIMFMFYVVFIFEMLFYYKKDVYCL